MTRPGQRSTANAEIEPRSAALEADAFTTWPTMWSLQGQGVGIIHAGTAELVAILMVSAHSSCDSSSGDLLTSNWC